MQRVRPGLVVWTYILLFAALICPPAWPILIGWIAYQIWRKKNPRKDRAILRSEQERYRREYDRVYGHGFEAQASRLGYPGVTPILPEAGPLAANRRQRRRPRLRP